MSTDLNLGSTDMIQEQQACSERLAVPRPCYIKHVFEYWAFIHIWPLSSNKSFTQKERIGGTRFFLCTFRGCNGYFSSSRHQLEYHLRQDHDIKDITGDRLKLGNIAQSQYVAFGSHCESFMHRKLITAKALVELTRSPSVQPPEPYKVPSPLAAASDPATGWYSSSSSDQGTNLSTDQFTGPGNELQERATNAVQNLNLQDSSSAEESAQEQGADMYIKDLKKKLHNLKTEQQKLQDALHVSDSSVNTFRKLNYQKQDKIDELETMVETLKGKAGRISSPANQGSHATEQECVRLRSEMRCLQEKNMKLVANMKSLRDLLSKNFLAGKEILAQSINGGHSTDAGHYQDSKKAEKYDQDIPPGFDDDIDVDGDTSDEDYDLKSERLRSTGSHDMKLFLMSSAVMAPGTEAAESSRYHEYERADQSDPVGRGSGVVRDRTSDEVRGFRKEVPDQGRTDMPVAGVKNQKFHDVGSAGDGQSSRPLISPDAQNLCRKFVEQRFINWVNSKLRKPTLEEMVYHKTQFTTNGKTCYWSGIPGAELLSKYGAACPNNLIPEKEELEMVLRMIVHVEACPMRPKDVLWCLVWRDCVKIQHLPGFHDMDVARARREMRRPRSPVVPRDEDFDRPLRQRYM